MTFDELLESDELRAAVGDKFPVYEGKFRTIIAKAGIGAADVSSLDDKQFVTHLTKTISWNWAAFFFSFMWYGYRQGNRWMEASAIASAGLMFLGYMLIAAGQDGLSTLIGLGFGVLVGMWGNNFYLISVVNAVRHGTVPQMPTKGANIAIVLLITLAISAGMNAVFLPILGVETAIQ